MRFNKILVKEAFWLTACLFVKSNKVAQLNAKFRLMLNWTLLRLFNVMIIA